MRHEKIEFVINKNGCFVCTNHIGAQERYPRICSYGKRVQLSRFIYIECFGDIPEGMLVCHTCDNTYCINPEHFFLGTHQDNMTDCANKGRNTYGEKASVSKLTSEDVAYIRSNPLKLSNSTLGRMFSVNKATISRVRTFEHWKHVKAAYYVEDKINRYGWEEMEHNCDGRQRMIAGIKKCFPDYENVAPPVEMFSGRMYLNFTADKPFRGKKKQVNVPVLLSKCPFCGEKYEVAGADGS